MRRGLFIGLLGCLLLAACTGMGEETPVSTLRISELMASNAHTLTDSYGDTSDWIEIVNLGDEPVSMAGICLSDGKKNLEKFSFSDSFVLGAGEYVLVYASGREEAWNGSEWHAAFKLSADGEQVTLSRGGEILDQVVFGPLGKDVAYALGEDGTYHTTTAPTPGEANRIEEDLPPSSAEAPEGLRLNEILTSNAIVKGGQSHDFIELYNPTNRPLSLAGYALSLSAQKQYVFPDKTSIPAGGYALVYCTQDDPPAKIPSNTYYAPFPIPAQDATVSLLSPEGEVLDQVRLSAQYGNISYGRPQGGTIFGYLEAPTPGGANQARAYATRHAAPVLETAPGFYSDAIQVSVASPDGAALYYTLDGSTPGPDSPTLEGALPFSSTTVLRIRASSNDTLSSETVTATYFVGLEVPVPVVSLTTDNTYLFASSTGLMVRGSGDVPNYERNWEYPIHIEYFQPDGTRALDQMCGFRIAGEISRLYSQKGLSLYARSGYGAGSFDIAPFDNRDFDSYHSLLLRAAGSEGAGNGVRFRDAMLTALGEDTHVLVQASQPVLVYLNGRCWGHYNLREKINKHFVAQHEGITDEAEINSIDLLERTGAVLNGSNEDYRALITFVKTHDLNDPENLAHVLSQVDVESYFDHCILEIITGNEDINNYKFYRVPGGKWKWILYDLDTAMGTLTDLPLFYFMKDIQAKPVHGFDHALFGALIQVPEMRDQFLRRTGELMAEKFTYSYLSARLLEWRDTLEPLIQYQIDSHGFLTWQNWYGALDKFDRFLRDRPPAVVEHFRSTFQLTDAEMAQYFGAFLQTL